MVPEIRRAALGVAKALLPRALYPSSLLRVAARRQLGLRVHGGPFAGMRYVDQAIWGAYIPKLTGTYEAELHPYVEKAIAARPEHVIDIGCAEGYYAVGLLTRLPQAQMTAFDTLEQSRRTVRRLAELNGVSARLHVLGSCDHSTLRACLQRTGASLIVCDIEGYELELLRLDLVPELAKLNLLVEVHDPKVPGCRETLVQRFSQTHRITQIEQTVRTIGDYPLDHGPRFLLAPFILKYGLNEFRSKGLAWLWLEAMPARDSDEPNAASS